jgi:uncharacterized protein DUF6249
MDDNIVAALAVTCIFGLPVMGWIVSRVLAHQERMEMLRRGVMPPPNTRDMRRAMKYGWASDAAQPEASNQYAYYADFHAQQQLRKGMQVAFVGLALLIGLGFIGYRGDGTFYPGPWLLGGLIPLFVGIAQIIGAVLNGASFGPMAGRQRFAPPPPAGTAPGPRVETGTAAPGPTYGGWRPGSVPEIEKPASPPDYRG